MLKPPKNWVDDRELSVARNFRREMEWIAWVDADKETKDCRWQPT